MARHYHWVDHTSQKEADKMIGSKDPARHRAIEPGLGFESQDDFVPNHRNFEEQFTMCPLWQPITC